MTTKLHNLLNLYDLVILRSILIIKAIYKSNQTKG